MPEDPQDPTDAADLAETVADYASLAARAAPLAMVGRAGRRRLAGMCIRSVPHAPGIHETALAVLAGGYRARLCIACCDVWHQHALANGLREYQTMINKLAGAIHVGDQKLIEELDEYANELEDKFYALGKAWVHGPAVEPAEVP